MAIANKPTTSQTGKNAEELVATYLQQQGLTLISSNYRCKFGEIDLIMRDNQPLAFVEVRLEAAPPSVVPQVASPRKNSVKSQLRQSIICNNMAIKPAVLIPC